MCLFNCNCSSFEKSLNDLKKEIRDLKIAIEKTTECIPIVKSDVSPENAAHLEIVNQNDIKRIKQGVIDLYEQLKKIKNHTISYESYSSFSKQVNHYRQIKAEKWRQGGLGLLGWLNEDFEIYTDTCEAIFKTLKFK